jgi:CubicO group peptidase (beta-lactamase class C family)
MFDRVRVVALALMLSATGCIQLSGATHAGRPVHFPPEVEAQIHRVENNLARRGASIGERMAAYRVPGVSIAVINHGVVEWARGYGVLEAGGFAPVTQDTLFQAASVSKPVTAMAALRLVQEGRASLDEDVNVRLTNWRLPESHHTSRQRVTLRMLLSHSAGINVHGFRGYAAGEPVPSFDRILNGQQPCNSQPIQVDSTPGQRWKYSGGGYLVVQQLISDVTRSWFAEAMHHTVLGPLGMTHSTFQQPLPEAQWPRAAAGHRADGSEIPGRWFTYPELSAAGLWTTPTDLARFMVEIQHASTGRPSRVLNHAMAQMMLTNHRGVSGLGVNVHGSGAGLRFSHGGVNQGYRSQIMGTFHTGQGAVVMTNGDGGNKLNGEIIEAIAAEYGWPPMNSNGRTPDADDEAAFNDVDDGLPEACATGQALALLSP